jgi:hypothetical protein
LDGPVRDQELKELTTSRIKRALLGSRLMMGKHWSTIVADPVQYDLLDRPLAKGLIRVQIAGDLAAEHPDVVAVLAQGLA